MDEWILDYDSGELLHPFEDGTAIDARGNIRMRISEDLSVNLSSNDLHYTPGWESDE